MMKYERLTGIHDNGYIETICSEKCPYWDRCDEGSHYCMAAVKYRLAELEDDLESGKIIRLPCKVGDTVYWLIASKYIIECVVSFINISVGKKTHFTVWVKQKCEGVENDFSSDDLDEEWFLTREEAEAKLKELQE